MVGTRRTAARRGVVNVYISQNLGYVENHISLSLAIESVGLLTATPIKTRDDKYVVAEGELYFYVTKQRPGSQNRSHIENFMK